MDDRVDACDRLGHTVAGCQIALRPLDLRIDPRLAREDPYLVPISLQAGHDRCAEMTGPSGYEDLHWTS